MLLIVFIGVLYSKGLHLLLCFASESEHKTCLFCSNFGEESLLFSIAFEHNGIFIGQGVNRSYIGSTSCEFDYYHAETWSLDMLKFCLDKLDYSHGYPDLQVYWCLPGKDIVDGLVCVDTEEVIAAMVNASKECKTLLLIVDEDNNIRTFYDDVILD